MHRDREHEEQRLNAVDQLTSLLKPQEQAFGALQATRVMTLAAMFEASGVQASVSVRTRRCCSAPSPQKPRPWCGCLTG